MIGGVEDHVHSLFALSKNHALKKIVEEVKKGSSKWVKSDGPKNRDFHWQAGYGAFSVSQSNLEDVKRYIENQEEHHRRMTFQDELRAWSHVPAMFGSRLACSAISLAPSSAPKESQDWKRAISGSDR